MSSEHNGTETGSTVALVAGGNSGVGAATVVKYRELGYSVAVFDLDCSATRQRWQDDAKVGAWDIDVTDYDGVKAGVDEVLQTFGGINILVNCVGWNTHSFFVDQEPAFWDKLIAINLLSGIYLTHAVLPHMTERRSGAIVLVSSDAGRVGTNGETVYAAAKGGVLAFVKSISREVTRFGVRANAVSPGPTDTAMFHEATKDQPKIAETMLRLVPMKRLAQPEEQADAIVYLTGPNSSFITGQTLSVNGGLNMF